MSYVPLNTAANYELQKRRKYSGNRQIAFVRTDRLVSAFRALYLLCT